MAITDLIPWRNKVPVRHGEEHPMEAMRQDMNRLLDEFFGGFGWGMSSRLVPFGERWDVFSPQVDVVESDKEVKVSADLPGLDEKDIQVTLSRNVLTISGEKKEEKEDKGKNYYRMERSYGSFQRSIPLPHDVDTNKVDATFEKGVLTVTLPKTPGAQDRIKIAIKSK